MIASKFRSRFNGPLPTRGAGSFPMRNQSDPYAALRDYVAYWKFNELGDSDDILDASSNALHVPTFNSPISTTGKVGTARNFISASSQYGLKASTALLKLNGKTWSINLWFQIANLGSYKILVSRDDGAGQKEFDLAVNDSNTLYVNFNSTAFFLISPTVLSINTWYNVQLDFTTGTKACNLYLNGVLEDSDVFSAELNNTTADWCFGAYAAGTSAHLDGKLDNCYLYDKIVDPLVFWNNGNGLDLGDAESSPTAGAAGLVGSMWGWLVGKLVGKQNAAS